MTAEEKARLFGHVFPVCDSPVEAEALAAFKKLRTLREKMGWPSFGDVLRKLESTITPEQLEAVQRERDDGQRACNEKETEKAALAQRNAALAGRVAALRSALWVMMNWRMVAGAAVAVPALGFGGWFWWKAEAAPDQQPVANATAQDNSARAALDAALRDVLSRARWVSGDTSPVTVRLNNIDWWILIRGSIDAKSHVDARGRPIERHCLQLYGSEAVRDQGVFIAPAPYLAFGAWLRWPQHAAECRMPGTRNYS